MKFDFTTIIDRTGHDSVALENMPGTPKEGFDPIPMWVADMSFPTVPAVPRALKKRADHALYGYFTPSDAYYDGIIGWHASRHNVTDLKREHIGYENGVLGGVVSGLNVLCSKGDKVLVHSPTYVGFTGSLTNNGYHIVHSPLHRDSEGIWRMDFADMEEKILANHIHTMIFCSPHNPTGRVWEPWELEQLVELCEKHDVYIICDEIWSDIILNGYRHTPLHKISAAARNRTITLYAPSKTFNLAGLVGSYHVIFNKRLKDRMDKEGSLSHYNSMNVLSMHALAAAYSAEGEQWLEELQQVLTENVNLALEFFNGIDGVSAARPQGTYMLFPDFTEWCRSHSRTMDDLLQAGREVGVGWQDGRAFHGPCHIRLNLALPRIRLQEALDRLKNHVFS